ncbi:MAG: hypothetical protein HY308_01000 [Gammaproteobacteria bacterium]|nr:hypothetical protein [Gammaproteobacteria bacterium]
MIRIDVSVVALCTLGCLLQVPLAQAQPPILTFTPKYESKLFINTIPAADCPASATRVVGAGPGLIAAANRAAFRAFCRATSLGENPPNGAVVNPLDARIRGQVDLSFRCQAGNPLPLAPTAVTPGPTAAGPEAPLINGIVNAPVARDNLAATGGWGFVLSGHPNPIVEPAFQALAARARSDIWHKFDATVTCGVDARGLPTYTIARTTLYTFFPSHKVWFYAGPATPAPGNLNPNIGQRSFGDLWFLPAIPAP